MSGTLLIVVLYSSSCWRCSHQDRAAVRAGVRRRFGRYQRTAQPGLNFILPFIERMIKVDMREQVVDVPRRRSYQGHATVTVDAIIYYEVTDPVKVLYNVPVPARDHQVAQTNLRNVIGDMSSTSR